MKIIVIGLLSFFAVSCFSEKKAIKEKNDLRNPHGLYEKEELLLSEDANFKKVKEAYKKLLAFASQKRGSMQVLDENYVVFHAARNSGDNPNLLILHIRKGIFPQSVNIEFQTDLQGEEEVLFKWQTSNVAALAVTQERIAHQIIEAGELSRIVLLN